MAEPADLNRRERRKLELHGRILEVAAELFESHGFHATKVADICDRVDIAHKTFFNHFPSKQDVLRGIARQALAELLGQIEEARKQPGDAIDHLHFFYEHSADLAEQAGPMHREFLTEILHVSHEAAAPDDARRLQGAFRALLEDGVDPDLVRRHGLQALTELVLGSYYALMFNRAHIEGYPLRERAMAQVRLLAGVLRPPEKE